MVIKLVIFKILPSIITSPKGEIHGLIDRQKNGPRRKDTGQSNYSHHQLIRITSELVLLSCFSFHKCNSSSVCTTAFHILHTDNLPTITPLNYMTRGTKQATSLTCILSHFMKPRVNTGSNVKTCSGINLFKLETHTNSVENTGTEVIKCLRSNVFTNLQQS